MSSENWTRILRQVEKLVEDDYQIVSFKSLSETFSIHVDLSKRILFAFFEKHWRICDVVFYLNGIQRSNWTRQILLVVPEQLQKCMEQCETITSIHVYCVGPKNSVTSMALQNLKDQKLHVNVDHQDASDDLYGIQYEREPGIPVDSMEIDSGPSFISKSVEAAPQRSPAALRKTDVCLQDQNEEMIMSPTKRQLLKREHDEEMDDEIIIQQKKHKSNTPKSSKPKKKKTKTEKLEHDGSAQPVHRTILKTTINEKGEEVLEEEEEDSSQVQDSKKSQIESIRSAFGVNTRLSTKQSSIMSFFNNK